MHIKAEKKVKSSFSKLIYIHKYLEIKQQTTICKLSLF